MEVPLDGEFTTITVHDQRKRRPGDEANTPLVRITVVERIKKARRHVEASPIACGTLIGDVCRFDVAILGVGDGQPLATIAAAVITGTAGEVLGRIECDDEVAVAVPLRNRWSARMRWTEERRLTQPQAPWPVA